MKQTERAKGDNFYSFSLSLSLSLSLAHLSYRQSCKDWVKRTEESDLMERRLKSRSAKAWHSSESKAWTIERN